MAGHARDRAWPANGDPGYPGFTRLTVATTGADLQVWMILRGLGLGLFIQPLQTLSVSVVSRQQMARATSLRNSTTTVVNAVGVAVFTSYLTQHATTHLGEATITCATQSGPSLQQAALQACIEQQTLTLGMNDTFFLAFIACAVCAVATILVGRDPALHAATDFNSKCAAAEAALNALQSAPSGETLDDAKKARDALRDRIEQAEKALRR
jgi:hypothetical protein